MKLKLHILLIVLFTTVSTFAQFPVTNGLVASYEFNNNLNDGIGTSNMVSSQGAASFATDRLNNANASLFVNKTKHQAYEFSGLNNTLSISFWASFLPNASAAERVLQVYDDTHGGGFRIEYNRPNGEISFSAQTFNTAPVVRTASLATTSSNVWHHFVVTLQLVNSNVEGRVYIDGSIESNLSMSFSAGSDLYNNTAPLLLSPINGSTNPAAYSGYIDDIYVFNRAINSTEVTTIYNYSAAPDIIYVDLNATGNNDGTSWANAYNDLQLALANVNINDEIWVAKGVYTPNLYLTKTFLVNDDNIKIYGGFAGTEANLQERDMTLINTINKTILSGDIDNNDDTNVSFGNATRTDNSNVVLGVVSRGVTLNGLTISDGYADALTGSGRYGAGIFLAQNTSNFTMENCIIKNNVAYWAAGLYANPSTNSSIKINACVFENNLGVLTGTFYAFPEALATMNLSITNSLFTSNRTEDDSTTDSNAIRRGLGGPAGWIRAVNAVSIINTTLVNNTFVNNVALGTGADTDFPVLGLSKSSTNIGISSNTIANNIFWGNTGNNGQPSLALGSMVDVINFAAGQITNNIDEEGFTNAGGIGAGANTNSNTNPNLTTDFKLQTTSTAAIDKGNNTAIPAGIALDLAGNSRIENTIVDLGAYEYDSTTLSIDNVNFSNDKIYPNPASSVVNIETDKEIELITVYSILGEKLMTKKGTKTLNVSQLNKGIYLLKVYYLNQSKSTSLKFIKN